MSHIWYWVGRVMLKIESVFHAASSYCLQRFFNKTQGK